MALGQKSLAAALTKLLESSDMVKSTTSILEQHGHDESYHELKPPQLVAYPKTVDDVSKILKYCNENQIPVVPFGSGSGLEGGVTATGGGVSIDLVNMDKIISIHPNDFDCTVQAGVTKDHLNEHLSAFGLFFPVDPGADASLCGMCATSASGTNAVRYGTMRENVLNLQVVLPSGQIIHTRGEGRRARKTSAGYNLTNLFIGSEGTLGIITSVTLKLYGIPENISAAVVHFEEISSAVEAVVKIMQKCVPVARIVFSELLDEVQVEACNKYSKLGLKVSPTIFLEFHSSESDMKFHVDLTTEICNKANKIPCDFQWASDKNQRDNLWKARHEAFYAVKSMKSNAKALITDVCVPISKLPSVLLDTKKDILESKLTGPIIGHVGDGNFHVFFMVSNEEEVKKAENLSDRIVKRALEAEGTCSGEHGVGLGKKKYLEEEVGPETMQLMRLIKHSLDPNNIMNPGKVL